MKPAHKSRREAPLWRLFYCYNIFLTNNSCSVIITIATPKASEGTPENGRYNVCGTRRTSRNSAVGHFSNSLICKFESVCHNLNAVAREHPVHWMTTATEAAQRRATMRDIARTCPPSADVSTAVHRSHPDPAKRRGTTSPRYSEINVRREPGNRYGPHVRHPSLPSYGCICSDLVEHFGALPMRRAIAASDVPSPRDRWQQRDQAHR